MNNLPPGYTAEELEPQLTQAELELKQAKEDESVEAMLDLIELEKADEK